MVSLSVYWEGEGFGFSSALGGEEAAALSPGQEEGAAF
jgi:hypothetical protein